MTAIRRKRHVGDTRSVLAMQLMQVPEGGGDAVAVNLTGLTVEFKMVKFDGTVVVAQTATGVSVSDAVNGKVEYDFSAPGSDTPGTFRAYFVVIDSEESDHFPVGHDLVIEIVADA